MKVQTRACSYIATQGDPSERMDNAMTLLGAHTASWGTGRKDMCKRGARHKGATSRMLHPDHAHEKT